MRTRQRCILDNRLVQWSEVTIGTTEIRPKLRIRSVRTIFDGDSMTASLPTPTHFGDVFAERMDFDRRETIAVAIDRMRYDLRCRDRLAICVIVRLQDRQHLLDCRYDWFLVQVLEEVSDFLNGRHGNDARMASAEESKDAKISNACG